MISSTVSPIATEASMAQRTTPIRVLRSMVSSCPAGPARRARDPAAGTCCHAPPTGATGVAMGTPALRRRGAIRCASRRGEARAGFDCGGQARPPACLARPIACWTMPGPGSSVFPGSPESTMTQRSPGLFTALLTWLALCPTPALAAGPAPVAPARASVVVRDSLFDANELRMTVTNVGNFASDAGGTPVYYPGLEWPKGSGHGAIFAGGLWVGAIVNGQTRVTVAEYASEFAAGPLDASGQPVDPGEINPAHRVYKIRRGDDASNPDWAQWPIALGAPNEGAGNPRVIGDQTLWSVYNDAVPSKHNVRPGSSPPLGLEVQQTVFGFNRPGPLGRMVFLDFLILNKGPNLLQNTYVAFWCDPDLGVPYDDLVGCDTTLDMGFCYNADEFDEVYGGHPPAVGMQLLKGPAVLGGDLRMTAFGRLFKNYLEPETPTQSYARFLGTREDGSVQTCAGQSTLFEVNGDPVLGPGPTNLGLSEALCLDVSPYDRRFMLSTGPFDFAPGTSKRVVIAVLVGGRVGIGDRLGNLERLRSYARVAREVYNRNFD